MRRLSITTLIFTLAVATSAVAAPDRAPAPETVASAQVTGTMLVVSPKIAYSSATLRVAGPDGYEAIAWSQGGDIALDLLADGHLAPVMRAGEEERTAESETSLPDGRYKYEVALQTASGLRFHRGRLWVDRGVVAGEVDRGMQSAESVAGPTQDVEFPDDAVNIQDDAHDGVTHLAMLSSPTGGPLISTTIENDHGDIRFRNRVGSGPNPGRMVIEFDGDVGIGQTAPLEDLHIARPSPAIRFDDTNPCPNNNPNWEIGPTGGFLDFGSREDCPGDANATWMSLNAATGNLGLGELTPQRKVHVTAGAPGLRLEASPSGQQWDLEATATHFALVNVTAGQFPIVVRANAPTVRMDNGGFGVGVAVPAATLHVGGSGRIDGDVALGSSRTLKTGFGTVNPTEMLARVADLPLASWRYKAEDEDKLHIGPFAEDFQRLFGLGDGETISVIDAQGVTLAAIQGLQQELAEKEAKDHARDARIVELQSENAELKSRLAAMEERLDQHR